MWVEQLLIKFGADLNLKFGHTTHAGLFYIECDDYQGIMLIKENASMEQCAKEAYIDILESQLKENSNVG